MPFSSYAKLPQHAPPQPTTLEPLGLVGPPALLLRLAAVCAPALDLLVAPHAGAQRDVDPRRRRKPKALGHLDQVQLVHVEDGPQAVRRVRLQVRSVPVLGRLVEVVVLGDERLQLALDVCWIPR